MCLVAQFGNCYFRFFLANFFNLRQSPTKNSSSVTVRFKVHLTPKYFFRLNNSLHLFETHCAFLHLYSPNLDFLQAVKVTKTDHLFHDRPSKGYGSIPGLMSQTYLHACLQRLNTMQISLLRQPRNRPIPLTSSVVQQMMASFRNFCSP